MLAIGDNGGGEPFSVSTNGGDEACPVYVWHPISEEVTLLAPSLRVFWPGWLSGIITT